MHIPCIFMLNVLKHADNHGLWMWMQKISINRCIMDIYIVEQWNLDAKIFAKCKILLGPLISLHPTLEDVRRPLKQVYFVT